MIFESLLIKNFRPFYGEQEILFAQPGQHNVTLIHAENGIGKTSLLNALTWVLFGEFSDDVEQQSDIVNHRAAQEEGETAEAVVTLRFRNGDSRYLVRRHVIRAEQGKRSTSLNSGVYLHIDHMGELSEPKNIDEHIQGLMPKEMWGYFFFNGERIDHLAMESSHKKVSEAVKVILGLRLLEQTRSDLKGQVSREFREQIARLGDADTRKTKLALDQIDQQLAEKKGRQQEIEENEVALQKRKAAILEDLSRNESTRLLQQEFIAREREQAQAQERREAIRLDIVAWLNRSGPMVFSEALSRQARTIIEEKRTRREVPFRYRAALLHDLLHDARCICDRPLEEGSSAREAVAVLLGQAGDDALEEAYTTANAVMQSIAQQLPDEADRFRRLFADRTHLLNDLRRVGEEISEIKGKIGDRAIESGSDLAARRDEVDKELRDTAVETDKLSRDMKLLTGAREKHEGEFKKSARREGAAALAQRRLQAVEETITLIDTVLERQVREVREYLSHEIDVAFRQMCRKDYWAELTEDYTLRVRKRVRVGDEEVRDVSKSTGENQITSLAFIGSLVKVAQEREQSQNSFVLGGGTFPVVMDSPFGSLDNEYRQGIAEWLPTVAPQVVVLVTGSQWQGVVDEALAPKVGREYMMAYHGPKAPKSSNLARLTLHGREYEQLRVDAEYEYTRIEEVK